MKKLALILVCLCPSTWGAIAFDAASQKSNTTAFFLSAPWQVSWSHTCTGSNLVLSVEVVYQTSAGTDFTHITGITYNSVALTLASSATTTTGHVGTEIWYLKGPSTGANTVLATFAAPAAGNIGGMIGAISLTGVDQTTPVDVSTNGAMASATSNSLSATTTKDNDWFVDSNYILNTNNMTSTSGTMRWGFIDTGDVAASTASTRGPLTPPGSFSMGYSWTNASTSDFAVVAFMPVQAAAATGAAYSKQNRIMKMEE